MVKAKMPPIKYQIYVIIAIICFDLNFKNIEKKKYKYKKYLP